MYLKSIIVLKLLLFKKMLQFRCTNCGEESDKWIYLSQDVGISSYNYLS